MSKAKTPEALVSLSGGPLDGRSTLIDTHETLGIDVDGVHYERTDASLGDHRVYRYAPEAGSAPGVELRESAVQTNILARDLDELGDAA